MLSTNTGHNRNYGRYPYGDYKTDSRLIFPVSKQDDRMHRKERILAVINDEKARVYRFESFDEEISVVTDAFQNNNMLLPAAMN